MTVSSPVTVGLGQRMGKGGAGFIDFHGKLGWAPVSQMITLFYLEGKIAGQRWGISGW